MPRWNNEAKRRQVGDELMPAATLAALLYCWPGVLLATAALFYAVPVSQVTLVTAESACCVSSDLSTICIPHLLEAYMF